MESRPANIIIESNIPFIRGLFEPLACVRYLPPEQITPEAMATADALITRTRTRCDAALLADSPCQIIASATIGLDHVDREYCASRSIEVHNAPGCNAPGVAQYVLSSVFTLLPADVDPSQLTLGIVGVGNIGRIVEAWARKLGFRVLLCDPPRAEKEGSEGFVGLDEIAREADIITFHTPLTRDGSHPTFHLASACFFRSLQRRPIVINAARGPVADTEAWIDAIRSGRVSHSVVDCWEGEPAISDQLLQLADIATPHIAGYSREGKIRATHMAAEAVATHFGWPAPKMSESAPDVPEEAITRTAILSSYNPLTDTANLRANPADFERLRNTYNYRPEPSAAHSIGG